MHNNNNLFQEPDKEIFHARMSELLSVLEKNKVNLKTMNALEIFGRAGDWHTTVYADKVKSLEVWEINPKWESVLKKNLPNAKIKIIDSIQTLNNSDDLPKFDLIVIDNPMNTFGPEINGVPQYCEHFDVIKKISKLIDKKAVIIFNINKKPFSYEQFPLWKKRRQEFYGSINTNNMSIEFLFSFYKEFFKSMGFETIFHFNLVRHEHADYFVYKIKKMTTT